MTNSPFGRVGTLTLNTQQLEVTEQAIAIYIRQLIIEKRESTYSEIIINRLKAAIEVEKIINLQKVPWR